MVLQLLINSKDILNKEELRMTITQKVEQKYFDHIVAGEKREVRLTADTVHKAIR